MQTPPRFFDLSPELIDLILFHLAPNSNAASLRALGKLLAVSKKLLPHVRRRLYKKCVLQLGDKRGRGNTLLDLIETGLVEPPATNGLSLRTFPLHDDPNYETRTTGIGSYVQCFKIRNPDQLDLLSAATLFDPAASLVPRAALPHTLALTKIIGALARMPNLLHLEIETQAGVRVQDPDSNHHSEDGAIEELLLELEGTLRSLNRLDSFAMAIPHNRQKLWILAQAACESLTSWTSPYVLAMSQWTHLAHLDLWRVYFQLPESYDQAPSFKLVSLQLYESELGGQKELEWLLGNFGDGRSCNLEALKIDDVDFIATPDNSSPLLSVFGSRHQHSIGLAPSFVSRLNTLSLIVLKSIAEEASGATSTFLSPLKALSKLNLGGAGVTSELWLSLFQSKSSKLAGELGHDMFLSIPPSATLKILRLSCCFNLPVRDIVDSLLVKSSCSALTYLDIHITASLPRSMSWEEMRDIPIPIWRWDPQASRDLVQLWWKDRKSTVGLYKNGAPAHESSSDEDYEDALEDEDDGEEEHIDPDALFEPSGLSEPEYNDWAELESDSEGSDF